MPGAVNASLTSEHNTGHRAAGVAYLLELMYIPAGFRNADRCGTKYLHCACAVSGGWRRRGQAEEQLSGHAHGHASGGGHFGGNTNMSDLVLWKLNYFTSMRATWHALS